MNNYINYDSIIANVPGFVNDSIHPYIEILKSDTQTIYSTGGIFPNTRTEYWKLTKSPRFGKRSFYHKVNYQGKIENLSFTKRQYIKNGGNLYFFREHGNQLILNDSLIHGLISSLQIKNTKECLFNKTEITGKVVQDGQTYYRLFLTGTCRKTGLKQNLIIDQNLRVIEDINLRRTINRKIKTTADKV